MRTPLAFLLCIFTLCGTIVPASYAATTGNIQTVSTKFLSDGITVETTVTVYQSFLRDSTKRATRESTYRDNGTTIATVTLDATFGYDGATAWVVSASASHWVASGWSYENQSVTTSGATARVTATLKKWLAFIPIGSIDVDDSLSCSANGTIS